MGKKKKRLSALVEAVTEILGSSPKAKKLKKAKALGRFIDKLEGKLAEIENDISTGELSDEEREAKSHQVKGLTKQIKKAKKILLSMS